MRTIPVDRRSASDAAASLTDRRQRLRRGIVAEAIAAAVLMLRGYRVLARRHKTPYGEIDIIAARRGGGRIAFVEVKRRRTMEDARAALTPHQASRIARAADHWLARHPRHRERDQGLDAMLVVPGCWPCHLPNALDRC
jgi:putative endonuclease